MIIENIPTASLNSLYISIYANMSTFKKRSISFIISPLSDSVASITLFVTGKRGTIQKDFVLIYDKVLLEWNVYAESRKYTIISLSELPSIIMTMLTKMSTTVTKI